jgi:hypothetical protein
MVGSERRHVMGLFGRAAMAVVCGILLLVEFVNGRLRAVRMA